jgi:hypothetical protein
VAFFLTRHWDLRGGHWLNPGGPAAPDQNIGHGYTPMNTDKESSRLKICVHLCSSVALYFFLWELVCGSFDFCRDSFFSLIACGPGSRELEISG